MTYDIAKAAREATAVDSECLHYAATGHEADAVRVLVEDSARWAVNVSLSLGVHDIYDAVTGATYDITDRSDND